MGATQNNRVLVGMSGGIDSTATCLMLQEQGYEVVGVTMRVFDLPGQSADDAACPAFIAEARDLAARLGIAHHVADEREGFRRIVVQGFIDEYMAGRTPNPCVMCNPTFKFRMLCEWADRLGCAHIATGHYVRLCHEGGVPQLYCGADRGKDQSYFLWRLTPEVLARCLFPLGGMQKGEVRHYLEERGLAVKARQGESMEVCFIPGDYRDFLRSQVPDIDSRVGPGHFVDVQGRTLGMHQGAPFYTVGQRKGLGISLGYPAYVLRINARKNTVVLGPADQLQATAMLVEGLQSSQPELLESPQLCVRIRYRSQPIACTLQMQPVAAAPQRWLVRFGQPASAVTPGQSAVFYVGDRLVGGAIIASQKGIGAYL